MEAQEIASLQAAIIVIVILILAAIAYTSILPRSHYIESTSSELLRSIGYIVFLVGCILIFSGHTLKQLRRARAKALEYTGGLLVIVSIPFDIAWLYTIQSDILDLAICWAVLILSIILFTYEITKR